MVFTKISMRKGNNIMINSNMFEAPKAHQNTRAKKVSNGFLTIVLSKKNGKRIEFLPNLCTALSLEDCVRLTFMGKSLVVMPAKEFSDFPVYELRQCGKKKIIYNASLAMEIAERLELDYSNCVSKTLNNVSIESYDGYEIAILTGDCKDED